jgi:hypothetical protein
MLFILAAIGAITVAVLLWRSFGAPASEPTQGTSRTKPARRVTAPDDDPEFLRSLGKQKPEDGDA